MADPALQSLDDYIKNQKKSGRMSFGGRGRGGRRGAKPNATSGGRGGGTSAGPSGNRANSFRGRKGRQSNNNVQRGGRGNRGIGSNKRNAGGAVAANQSRSRNNFQRFRSGGPGGQVQTQQSRNRNRNRNRNPSRQIGRQRNAGIVNPGFPKQQRYFNKLPALINLQPTGRRASRNQPRRLRQKKVAGLGNPVAGLNVRTAAATKRAVLKLAQKRVQRAKLLVGKKRIAGIGAPKKLMAGTVGRVALGKNGFFTVRNTKAKQLERTLVQMKIARAQNARNKVSPQQQQRVNMPGSSRMRNRSVNNRSARAANASVRPQPVEWNTPIVRTMRNDLVDEMTAGQLNPEIQRKIAFIQSRSKGDRAPVLQDFKAPVTTSRMKLSDRFRLLRDH